MKLPYVQILIVLLLIMVSCASGSKKALQKAQEFENAGLYVEAAEYDLKALREKPDFQEALVHLRHVAPKAYNDLLGRAASHEKAGNWDDAVKAYKHLQGLLNGFTHHGVVFETVDVGKRLATAERKAAEFHYAEAEALFARSKWQHAAYAYLMAHNLIDNYKGAFEKAIQSFLNAGDDWLSKKSYTKALEMYKKSLEIAPGHGKATRRVASVHYELGKQFFKEGRFREALQAFEAAASFVEDYGDVAQWIERAYDKAVQLVGVFPFQNQTRHPVDGYFLASEILGRSIQANLKFVEFLAESEMHALANKLRRSSSDRVLEVELLKLANDEGLDAVVWGKVRNVAIQDRPESFEEHEHEKTIVVVDTSGEEIEEITPIFYREYTKSRRVRLEVESLILETKSGKILDRDSFREDLFDEARWIAYQGSIYDLPESKRHYLDAPRDPRLPAVLIDELLVSVARKISREVVKFYK